LAIGAFGGIAPMHCLNATASEVSHRSLLTVESLVWEPCENLQAARIPHSSLWIVRCQIGPLGLHAHALVALATIHAIVEYRCQRRAVAILAQKALKRLVPVTAIIVSVDFHCLV
jgi:hypothetical protein